MDTFEAVPQVIVGVLSLEGLDADTGGLTNSELAAIATKPTSAIDNLSPILGVL
jgi:hypothetical protein